MKLPKILTYTFYILLSVIFVAPIYWSFISSLKDNDTISSQMIPFSAESFLPVSLSFSAYIQIMQNSLFTSALVNTLFVCLVLIVIGGLINAFAGYTFATEKIPLKKLLLAIVVLSFLVPGDLLAIPSYNIIDKLGWLDTKAALIVPNLANGIVILMFYLFFLQIPKAMMEAAVIDGMTKIQVFFCIYVPLSLPTIIGGSLMVFIMQWEQFLWPLLVARSEENMMIQVAITSFRTQYVTLWNQQFAAATISLLLPLGILLPLQRYYVASVVGTAIK